MPAFPGSLFKQEGVELKVFLIGDAVAGAQGGHGRSLEPGEREDQNQAGLPKRSELQRPGGAECGSQLLGGDGIAQVLELYARPLLADGRLVQVLPEWADETYPLYAYHRHRGPVQERDAPRAVVGCRAGQTHTSA